MRTMETETESSGASVLGHGFKVEVDWVKDDTERHWNACTGDGSVDWYGKPAVQGRTGGWRCGMLLLVNQGLVMLAISGIEVNLVLFSKTVLRQTNAEAANTFSRWIGTVYFFSLFGAFLSDSYLGRYLTGVIFQVVFIIGLVAISLSTQLFLLKPEDCGKIGQLCESHAPTEVAIFYISLYLIALGNGIPEPALAAFGADQFDEEDSKENKSKTSFYSYFYVARNLGCLVAETILVYIENMGNWVLGFWLCAASAILAFLLLLSGTSRYRHFKPCGNSLSRFSQVIVASLRKVNLEMPSNGEGLYEFHGREGNTSATTRNRILHSNGFKFLDRAAIITQEDKTTLAKNKSNNQWRLCSVSQVEEVKCILRLLPVWLCTIFSSVVFIQMLSLSIVQGAAMDTTVVSNFHIPPASMTTFDIVSTSAFILLYDNLIVPLYEKVTKRQPKPPSELQRIGIGLAIATVAMIIAGIVEQQRLKYAGDKETSSLSIFWQTPQYILIGVSEAFVYVAQMEFFASETPEGLKSLGMGLAMFSSALGSYVATFLLTVVMEITTKNGKPGWVPPNLNVGHLDRYFFLSAALTLLNLVFYVICAKRYEGISLEKPEEEEEEASEMKVRHSDETQSIIT